MNGKKRWILSFVVGITISVLFFYWVLRGVKWREVVHTWSQLHWGWATLAAVLYLFGQWLRGIRCAWILRPYRRISSWEGTQLVWIGYAANNLLPARLGELVRSYVLSRREQLSYGISLSTLLIERILDGLAIVGILWVAGGFVSRQPWIDEIGWVAGAIFMAALLVVLVARIWTTFFQKTLSWMVQFLPQGPGKTIEGFGHRLLDGTSCLGWDRYLPGILGMSVMIWLVEGSMFAVMLVAFGWPLSWLAAYLAMSITNLGVLVPSSPGHLGTFHAFCAKVLLLVGVVSSKSDALSYAAAVHLLQLVPVTILGLWALHHYGFNLRSVWKLRQQHAEVSTPEEHSPPPKKQHSLQSQLPKPARIAPRRTP